MKKTKQSSSPATNKTTLKQKEQQMKHNGPSMFHDDQLSLTLAFFASPKYRNSSSIRLLFHPYFYLSLVHTKKKLTHFQVTCFTTPFFKIYDLIDPSLINKMVDLQVFSCPFPVILIHVFYDTSLATFILFLRTLPILVYKKKHSALPSYSQDSSSYLVYAS
jgi:hypothetical protein